MMPVKTTPVTGGGGIKENNGGREVKYNIFDAL
jgi:hypothetical protein